MIEHQPALYVANAPKVRRGVNEEPKPSTSELKGVHHTRCPFGYVGWGRVWEVTTGRNLPRQCAETILLFLFSCAVIASAASTDQQPIAILISEIDGVVYKSSFIRADIEKTPPWRQDEEENPPLSPVKAMRAAQRTIESII